jgi:hypothetical protein
MGALGKLVQDRLEAPPGSGSESKLARRTSLLRTVRDPPPSTDPELSITPFPLNRPNEQPRTDVERTTEYHLD